MQLLHLVTIQNWLPSDNEAVELPGGSIKMGNVTMLNDRSVKNNVVQSRNYSDAHTPCIVNNRWEPKQKGRSDDQCCKDGG